MNEQERTYELNRLQATLQEVKKQLSESADNCDDQQLALQSTLQDYWSNTGGNVHDEAQLVETVGRQKAISAIFHQRYRQLKTMLNSPYFGRIDFAENHTSAQFAEQIYIGISSLGDSGTGNFLIYDWRTPIASMYYDFERGSAWYESLDGRITGEISLKRQFKISKGSMQYMFDVDLQIIDEMLQELLSKNADDKMHTIVNSIQREQNQIIRDEKHRLLCVQGPAGCGKTSIALHRIAFLLYRDRERLTAKNVLILSPNHIFSDYISNVLPEMGEENVLQMTFQDYVQNTASQLNLNFETRSDHLETILDSSNCLDLSVKVSSVRYKSSSAFAAVLENFIVFLQENLIQDYPPIRFKGQTLFSQDDWHNYFYESLAFLPILRRLMKIHELIQLRMRALVRSVREEKAAEITATAEEVNETTIRALARISAKKELDPLLQQISLLTELTPLSLYRKLWEDEKLFKQLANGLDLPDRWSEIRELTLRNLAAAQIPYEDSSPFLYLQGVLEGFPLRQDVKHLVIDEAQDYTSLQYKILTQMFRNCSWTILGDPAQAIHPCLKTADFEAAINIIGLKESRIIELTRSYRSTKEIMSFFQALLPSANDIQSINRPGTLPVIIKLEEPSLLIAAANDTIDEILNEGFQSIGIICKTASEAKFLFNNLIAQRNLSLVMSEDETFYRGLVVIPAYLAKGLEFDAVIAVNVDSSTYQREGEDHILYTICTRALHRLYLIYDENPSPFLSRINTNLYQSRRYL